MLLKVIDYKNSDHTFMRHSNLINMPTSKFMSSNFSYKIEDISIKGVYAQNFIFFETIKSINDMQICAENFINYMEVRFGKKNKKGKFVTDYEKILKGWMFDSNSIEGAVLKGWVESRFGILPYYHKQIIPSINSSEYYEYMSEKMDSRFNNSSIYIQLDILYTFTQLMIKKFYNKLLPKIRLYRGINEMYAPLIIEKYSNKDLLIEHNSISSFSLDRDIAGGFGDYILTSIVPYPKILFFTHLLPNVKFRGEGEYLIIGGRYETEVGIL